MIGIFSNSIPGHETLSPEAIMDAAQLLGLQGVMFGSALALAPDLSPNVMKSIAAQAAARSLHLAAGAGIFNPLRPARNPALIAVGGGDATEGLARVLRAMPMLGVRKLFFVVGMIEDRDDPHVPWQAQIEGIVKAVRTLEPTIRASGVRLLIKTHEEISSFEILRILDAVGGNLLGVAHDPVNVACRLEDAVACTRRLAAHIEQLHVDDALVTFEEFRMRRYLTPIGTGDIDWPAISRLCRPTPISGPNCIAVSFRCPCSIEAGLMLNPTPRSTSTVRWFVRRFSARYRRTRHPIKPIHLRESLPWSSG